MAPLRIYVGQGSFENICRALLRIYMALLRIYRALFEKM